MFVVPLTGLVIGVFVIIFRAQLVNVFNLGATISDTTLQTAQTIMLIYGIELAVRDVPYVAIVGIFRSGGDTKKGMQYEMLCLWAFSVPMTILAAFVLKLPFVLVFACSYICEDYIKAFLCIRYFKTNKWIQPVTEQGKTGLRQYLAQQES